MPGSNYQVASAATLLGAKPPKRREIEDIYFAQMAADNKQTQNVKQPTEKSGKEKEKGSTFEKKVRFTPSTLLSHREEWEQEADHVKADEENMEDRGVAATYQQHDPSTTSNTADSEDVGVVVGVDRHPKPSNRQDPGRERPARSEEKAVGVAARASRTTTLPATLPFAHQHRLRAQHHHAAATSARVGVPTGPGTSRLDTSPLTLSTIPDGRDAHSAAGPHAGQQKSGRDVLRAAGAQDLYFSPVDVHRHTIEFGNAFPMSAVQEGLASDSTVVDGDDRAAGQQYDEHDIPIECNSEQKYEQQQRSYGKSRGRPSMAKTKKERITVSPEQLDRLVVSLASAPMVQTHLRKQWLEEDQQDEEAQDKPSMLSLRSALLGLEPKAASDSTPSLTNNSTASEVQSDSSSTLYSRANTPFCSEERNVPFEDDIMNDFSQDYPDHPLARKRPQVKFGGIAITDPKVHGAPIRFVSKGYKKGSNVLQVGQCSFLNVPYGASVDCILRVEPGDSANGGAGCSITVQVMSQVLERKSGKKVYLLIAEVDVTESITKAALVELSAYTGFSLSDIDVYRPAPSPPIRHDSAHSSIDWCAIADESLAASTTDTTLEHAARSFKTLDPETCTMQTLTLLSELERIKAQHVDFLVLRAGTGTHSNGMPTGITVPWISQHLDHHVSLWSPEACGLFRRDLVTAVARRHRDGEPFAVKVLWGRKRKIVRCQPLLEGGGETTAGWVCFVGDEFDL